MPLKPFMCPHCAKEVDQKEILRWITEQLMVKAMEQAFEMIMQLPPPAKQAVAANAG